MPDDVPMVSRDHMETQIAIAKVEALLSVQRDDLIKHTEKDDAAFNDLYIMSRNVREDITKIPEKMSKCRIELKNEMIEDMEENFVSQKAFEVFQTKIIYAITGGICVAGVIQWLLSTFISLNKLGGG